jgi:hypothetical protein
MSNRRATAISVADASISRMESSNCVDPGMLSSTNDVGTAVGRRLEASNSDIGGGDMLFMASIIYDPSSPRRADDPGTLQPQHAALEAELRQAGQHRVGAGLYPAERGKRIDKRRGTTQITDGPFAETKEAIGGFFIYECDDIAAAVEIGTRIPCDSRSFVEVRPLGLLHIDQSRPLANRTSNHQQA